MALRFNYVARETGSNLWRNISLTVATLLTVVVSLSLFGFGQIISYGIGNATARWNGGIEFIVFMQPTASEEQLKAVQQKLEENPDVKGVVPVDKAAAFEEFKKLFQRSPEMVDAVTADAMPPSFRVEPSSTDATLINELGKQFEDDPGVREVVFAFETVRTLQKFTNFIQGVIRWVSIFLLVAALLLILNTIRMAMFARRREIEVMKLVGATNWFIRVPFILEGLIQGVLGALVAMGLTWVAKWGIDAKLAGNKSLQIFEGFVVTNGQLTTTWLFLLVLGSLVGGVGSAIAVSRYLDV